jgi:membrane protease YdiL (CAAX protease family)
MLRCVRRAILVAVALTLAWHAALFAADGLLPPLGSDAWPSTGATVVNLVAALVPLAVLVGSGWWRADWLWQGRPREPGLLVPALVLAALPVAQGVEGRATVLLSSAVLFLCLGLSEELLSRGVVQEVLRGLPPVPRVLWVGALFGLGHVLSAAWFGRPLDDTLVQLVSASTFGVGYAALRLRTGTLWPLVVLHGLDDWTQVNSPGAQPDWLQLLVAVFWLGYGVRLARAANATWTSSRTG